MTSRCRAERGPASIHGQKMQVGDSFLVPTTDRKVVQRVGASMSMETKRHGGKYAMRLLKEGIRVWRVE